MSIRFLCSQYAHVCVCGGGGVYMWVGGWVGVHAHAFRIVSVDKIFHFINTLIIILLIITNEADDIQCSLSSAVTFLSQSLNVFIKS